MRRMEKFKNILLKSLPIFVAILLFGAISLIGFKPQLEGKVLPQHDTQQFNGMSRDIRECREQFGEDPQWTGAMFSGMPAYQINIKYPTQIVKRSVDLGRPYSRFGLWPFNLLLPHYRRRTHYQDVGVGLCPCNARCHTLHLAP